MAVEDEANGLLTGPRGRRLCWELVTDRISRGCTGSDETTGDKSQLAAQLADAIRGIDLAELAAIAPSALFRALDETVSAAKYWQAPDSTDRVLARPDLIAPLSRVAQAVSSAPEARWWTTPIDQEDQRVVTFRDPPVLGGAAAAVEQWRAETLEDEHAAGP